MKTKCPNCNYSYELTPNERTNRTDRQNRLYWIRITIIGDVLGYDKDTMHQVMKRLYLKDHLGVLPKDEFLEYLQRISDEFPTTTKLSTAEMAGYMDFVEMQANELQIALPMPEDYEYN